MYEGEDILGIVLEVCIELDNYVGFISPRRYQPRADSSPQSTVDLMAQNPVCSGLFSKRSCLVAGTIIDDINVQPDMELFKGLFLCKNCGDSFMDSLLVRYRQE